MPIAAGFFVDWDGNARSTLDPGGGYVCDTDPASRYVAVTTKGGTLVHEGHALQGRGGHREGRHQGAAGSGSHPWGRPEEGF